MSAREERSKKRRRRLEDLDTEELKELETEELMKGVIGLLDQACSSRSHNRSRTRKASDKENSHSQKKSKKSKQSERSQTSSISEDRGFCTCSTRDAKTEENRRKSAEDKMADIAAALTGEGAPATAAPLAVSSRSENSSFVDEWKRIAREGLRAEEVEEIVAKYETSEDSVKELRAPELNVEVRSLVNSTALNIDDSYAARQNQFAVQLSVIDRVLGLIAERGKHSAEVARLVQYLRDFGRNNADIHHEISLARRHAIVSALNVKDAEAAEIQCEVGEKLFSRSMEMLLYKQKVRTDVEEAVKPIVASLKEYFEEIVKAIAANWEKDFLERLNEVAAELKKDLAQAQNAVVAPAEEAQGAHESTAESRTPEVEAKVEGARSAKVEGARSAKVEAAANPIVTSYVPTEREACPGAEYLVERASEQRGVPNKFSTFVENTRKQYGRHITAWWYFCQREQKDVFQPSASDVLAFYQEHARIRFPMDVCKRAMAHLMPERIVKNSNIILFLTRIKNEPI